MDLPTLQTNWDAAIVYYCYMASPSYVSTDLSGACSDICTSAYSSDGTLEISNWLLTSPPEPTIEELMTYSAEVVNEYYLPIYVYPSQLAQYQPFYNLTGSQLNSIPAEYIQKGYLAYNTTEQMVQYWNGSAWVDI